MKRSKQREQAFFLTFEKMFSKDNDVDLVELYCESIEEVGDYAKALYEGVNANIEDLDNTISNYLKGWKIHRISKVNLAILRIAVYEIKCVDDVPPSVAINEAVELAKKYSNPEDASYINGVLGSVLRGME